jgi:hypothetical protein
VSRDSSLTGRAVRHCAALRGVRGGELGQNASLPDTRKPSGELANCKEKQLVTRFWRYGKTPPSHSSPTPNRQSYDGELQRRRRAVAR